MKEQREPSRRLRADALRNRERLLEVAKSAFAEVGPDASLEEIARRAGVGIGTLYRHFPTRDAMIAAVYGREIDQLAASADSLLAEVPPGEALRQWMRVFADYLATKKVIAAAIGTRPGGTSALYEGSGDVIRRAVDRLLARGIASGDVRPDIETGDLMQALAGLAYGVGNANWRASVQRLIEVIVAGLRP